MAVLPIDTSVLRLQETIVEVLRAHLPGELLAMEARNPGYPLPCPDGYLLAHSDPQRTFQQMNFDSVAVWVTKERASQNVSTYTGSGKGGSRARTQDTMIRVTLLARSLVGFDPPFEAFLGRKRQESEWLDKRAELYKGAIINTLCKHAIGEVIADLLPDANHAEYSEINNFGKVAIATVIFGTSQDVLVPC